MIYSARMDNVMRCIGEFIPYLLHGLTYGYSVVPKGIILTSNLHHESWDKDTAPDVSVDSLRKVLNLKLFTRIC